MQVAVLDSIVIPVKSASAQKVFQKQLITRWEKLWPPTVVQLLCHLDMYGEAFTDDKFEIQCLHVIGSLASKMQYEGQEWLAYYMSLERACHPLYLPHDCNDTERAIVYKIVQDPLLRERLFFLFVWELPHFLGEDFAKQVFNWHLKYARGIDQ